MTKPQILTLNLTVKANKILKEKGFNIYEGSLGKLIDTKNQKYQHKYCLLNHDFPPNIHEFDIVIIDLSNEDTTEYRKDENTRVNNKSGNNTYLLCEYPQTVFDPRGLSSHILMKEIKEIIHNEAMIIVFQNENAEIEYEIVEEHGDRHKSKGIEIHSIYEFMPYFPFTKNKYGKTTEVILKQSEIANFLNKYNEDFVYENIFYHPTIWKDEEQIPHPSFHPIIKNASDEIISYIYIGEKYGLYTFPILKDNSNFIVEFLENIAPTIHPTLFPNSSQKKWTNSKEYSLPNHQKLLAEKEAIRKEYELKTKKKETEILDNNKKYSFLHEILTETGDELVFSVINFLKWLGFQNVIDMDEKAETIKEEDIQIENDKGLLVIEVKGIGGTSKDTECSQISKIKYRRAKQRGSFDVFGLYIVNHQRHLPAKNRENPPLTKEQKQDAVNDERGLLTTWQLFNLYYNIQKGIITKEEARDSFYEYGLIAFKPKNITPLGKIDEIFLKGEVFILKLNGIEIKTGDNIFIEKNNEFRKLTILEIKLDDKVVDKINKGEVGIKGNIKVSKKSTVWIKNLP
ncbi:hypothetical protein [Winogradskyella psychrotolerans]|uniref:hypothetical protein n=1 Tax=Winogradskyella psychrotolerans TaxID=1344585 RepID=UPI001C07317F|nr:hypothetical protein [Winogradskyella psychrotolerans]MBU2928205.1 hypothetical protein [Winogradskyella psychrotolerans]